MKATCRTQYLSFSRHTGVLREAVLKPLGVRVSAALALQLSEVKAIAQAGLNQAGRERERGRGKTRSSLGRAEVLFDLGISSPQFDDAGRGFRPEAENSKRA